MALVLGVTAATVLAGCSVDANATQPETTNQPTAATTESNPGQDLTQGVDIPAETKQPAETQSQENTAEYDGVLYQLPPIPQDVINAIIANQQKFGLNVTDIIWRYEPTDKIFYIDIFIDGVSMTIVTPKQIKDLFGVDCPSPKPVA